MELPPGADGSPAPPMRTAHCRLEDCPPGLADEWQALAAGDAAGGFFAGPGFVHAFAATFAGRAECLVLSFRSDAALVGLLPLMRSRVRRGAGLAVRHDYMAGDAALLAVPGRKPFALRQISPLLGLEASLMSCRILAAPGWHRAVWTALPAALAALPGWDIAAFPLADPGLSLLEEAAPLSRRVTLDRPMQALDPVVPSASLIEAGNKKFRQNMRRAARFAEEAGISLGILTGDDARAALPSFAALAEQSWKSRADSDRAQGEAAVVPYRGAQQALAERLAHAPALRPVLACATGPQGLRAACLAFASPSSLTTFVLVQDADAGRESLGHLVLHRLIDFAHEQALPRLDFNANSGWLKAYANRVDMVQGLTLFPPGLHGRALALLARMTARGGPG